MTTFSASSVNGLSAVETSVSGPSDSKVSEWFIYLVDVPRNWDYPRHHTASPKSGPKVSYRAAAESVASMNRHYLQRYKGKSKKSWTICILRGSGYAVLQMPINKRFRPQNEFVMPKTEFVELCIVAELREKLATINKVISTFRPKSGSMKWAVAAKSIVLNDLPEPDIALAHEAFYRIKDGNGRVIETGFSTKEEAEAYTSTVNRLIRDGEPQEFFERYEARPGGCLSDLLYDVFTSAGQILQTGLTQAQADEYADLHNSLTQNAENQAMVRLSNS